MKTGNVTDEMVVSNIKGVSDKWLDNVREAKAKGVKDVRFQLNRSAFVIGMQIARGKVEEKPSALELIRVGVMAGLNNSQAADTVAMGMNEGKKKELRAMAEKERELSAVKESWGLDPDASPLEPPKSNGEVAAAKVTEEGTPVAQPNHAPEELSPVFEDPLML